MLLVKQKPKVEVKFVYRCQSESVKTYLYGAVCRKRIRGVIMKLY